MKLLLLILSFSVFAQTNTTEKVLEEFIKQRKRMMEEVMKAFEDDDMMMDDFFKDDDFMKDFKSGNLGNRSGFKGIGGDFTIEERGDQNGNMAILITPKDKSVNLDIKTENNQIVIKSERKEKIENQGQSGTSTSFSTSSYTRAIGIPSGYIASAPTVEGNAIKIELTPQKNQKIQKNERIPISKPQDGETL